MNSSKDLKTTVIRLRRLAGMEWLLREVELENFSAEGGWLVPQNSAAFFYASDLGLRDWSITLELCHDEGMGPTLILGRQIHEFSTGHPAHPRSAISSYGVTAASTGSFSFPPEQWVPLECRRSSGILSVGFRDGSLLEAMDPDPNRPIKDLEIHLPKGTRIRKLEIRGGGKPCERWRPRNRGNLRRSVTIDFFDDTIGGFWTQSGIEKMMEIHRRSGISRVFFIPTNPVDDGFWNQQMPARPEHRKHIMRTREEIGEFLPAFAEAAKSRGLEFFAVFKPYEEAFIGHSLPEGSREGKIHGRLPSLSGPVWWASDWITRHPELRLRRHPADLNAVQCAGPLHRLVARSEVPAPGVSLGLWGSNDNLHFEKLQCCVTRLDDYTIEFTLPTGAPRFLALLREVGSVGMFGHRLAELVSCFDEAGRKVPVTWAAVSDVSRRHRKGAFPKVTFAFDVTHSGKQLPNGGQSFFCLMEDAPLGIVPGVEPFIIGAPCPCYPEVRNHWLAEIQRCFDAGCDGVDIRIANHNRTFAWERYGFNQPVLDALGPDPSVPAVRKFLGESYTGFLRNARRLAKEAGKPLHLHFEHGFHTPNLPCSMNHAFPWEQWLEEGLADEATLCTHSAGAGIMPSMARKAAALGIPVNVRPYLNGMVSGSLSRFMINRMVRDLELFGADGLNIYENAAFFSVNSRGEPVAGKGAQWWEVLTGVRI
jgi:hypothetical protein